MSNIRSRYSSTSPYWKDQLGTSKTASAQKGDDLASKLPGSLDANGRAALASKSPAWIKTRMRPWIPTEMESPL